jgi:hypothetical protein
VFIIQVSDVLVDVLIVVIKIPVMNDKFEENKSDNLVGREYICLKCGSEMQPYSFGLGTECRCIECGYKDPCCE